jgi:ABC-type cobalamin/Fe3+-siderophores transport system ATPase subunit
MPTDLRPFKKASEHELNWMHAARNEVMRKPAPLADQKMMRTDMIPIIFEDLTYSYGDNVICRNVNLNVKQGHMVALAGDHGCGKATLLKLIGRLMVPDKGNIFIPPHLRILFVSQEPSILLDLSLWENLTMGCPDGIDPGLVQSILQEMGMNRTLKALEYFRDGVGGPGAAATAQESNLPEEYSSRDLLLGGGAADSAPHGKGGVTKQSKAELQEREAKKRKELAQWFDKLNYTEKVKLHLARALIMNAELTVLHRPLYHFNEKFGKKVMALIKQHHNNRGLCMPVTTMNRRRPRTVFLTVDDEWEENVADIIWRLDPKTKTISEHKPKIISEAKKVVENLEHRMGYDNEVPTLPSDNPIPMQQNQSWNKIGDWCFSPRGATQGIQTGK